MIKVVRDTIIEVETRIEESIDIHIIKDIN